MMSRDAEKLHDTRLLVPLRVLYTLDTSPQYLLARQRRRVQVVPILEAEGDERAPSSLESTEGTIGRHRYAKVSLKTCLGAVCNASPELVCDRSRDYSVYVVDPLESPPNDDNTVHASQPSHTDIASGNASLTSCPWGEGVSIGMGLMSWCLADNRISPPGPEDDDDEGYVIGKFVRDRGADALEIVMSLRETATQTQHQHALSLSSWGMPAPSTALSSGVSSPTAQLSSPFPTSPSPNPLPASSRQLMVRAALDDEDLPENTEGLPSQAHPSASDPMLYSSQPADIPTQAKTKKIGRPPGAKTHPEKRARQLAIQMHKEKLERLQNIVKMQNGEKYDKTLIIASECQSKVTDDIIARERKLLEELQSRPLIVDVPHFTTQPLPKRKTSPATHIPLAKTTAPKRKRKVATSSNAVASSSGSAGGESFGDGVESTSAATKEASEANLLLSLLSSVLGNVDEPPTADATAISAAALQGNGKGKEKEQLPLVGNALAYALQKLLPHLPNRGTEPSEADSQSVDAPSISSTNMAGNTITHLPINTGDSQAQPEPGRAYSRHLYPRPFKTAEESFYSDVGPNWPYDGHWAARRHVASKGCVPKVREDAHPVPGGGWARGKNIVPRVKTFSQLETASSDRHPPDDDTMIRSSASTTVATPDKENMPPAKSKRGLKRSLSTSTDAKENPTSGDSPPSKSGAKKRKQDDVARISRSKATKRTMMGSTGANNATFPASSPVRSRTFASPSRSLPVVAMSEPSSMLPAVVEPPLVATSMFTNLQIGTPVTPPRSDRLSGESIGPLIASSASSNSAMRVPRTPPRSDRHLDDYVGESLFTPCAPASESQLADALLHNEGLSSPTPVKPPSSAKLDHPSVDLHERPSRTSEEVDYHQGATLRSRHVGTGWDLPPSSPPPPTSPILAGNGVDTEEDQMDWDFAMQLQSELDVEMEKAGADRGFEDHGTTIKSAGTSTPVAGVYIDDDGPSDQPSAFEAALSEFDVSSDDVFNLGELGHVGTTPQPEGGEAIELDIDELWSSLGPVIAHAQLDTGSHADTELGFYGLATDQSPADVEDQGVVDPVKLAEDLKALFGGCVV